MKEDIFQKFTFLKGQYHEIFDFWFFSWISFPQAPEYTITAILNFFENSRRYSRLMMHHRCCWHRWQMEKSSSRKILIILLGHLWCTLTCENPLEFSKKFEMNLMLFSWAWGKVIHEKILKQKISWHCPFKSRNDTHIWPSRDTGVRMLNPTWSPWAGTTSWPR